MVRCLLFIEAREMEPPQEDSMNSDTLKGQWTELKGKVREQWGKLTDDDVETIGGQAQQLVGKIQQRYGLAREEAQRQFDEWKAEERQHVGKARS